MSGWSVMINANAPGNMAGRFLLSLLLLPAIVIGAENEAEAVPAAEDLLREMTAALRELNYDGVFIYRYGRSTDTLRVLHKSDPHTGVQERLVSLSGTPREVLRNNHSVTCIFPDKELVLVEKSRGHDLLGSHIPESAAAIKDFYRMAITGHSRIAGHAAWLLTISPLDQYRYGYQMWIAKNSKLLLKSILYNKSGYPLEEIIFTKLDVLPEIPDSHLQPAIQTNQFTWKHSADRLPTGTSQSIPWRINWLPPGFTVHSYEKQLGHTSPEHIVLTDGLAVVSVFIEKTGPHRNINGPVRAGALNAFARLMRGYKVTAIGEVPPATVQRMAGSIVSRR
ncbi:MAG: MucB/RseB C-terminal domain-containing protein [Gammaproteobacteria bacterium]